MSTALAIGLLLGNAGMASQPSNVDGGRRVVANGDVRVTSGGDTRITGLAPSDVRVLPNGDVRVTSGGDVRVVT